MNRDMGKVSEGWKTGVALSGPPEVALGSDGGE